MQTGRVVILLADISGYTRFMIENRTSAVHGQMCIDTLVESLIAEVDVPLTLQEIEGDAVFLYARDPGSDDAWERVLEEVSRKVERFFQVFLDRIGALVESTPCGCAICRNSEQLGLKIVVHVGEAVFHDVAGRQQVSGADVILAHRLLKNSLEQHEYLLLTAEAHAGMGAHLVGDFQAHDESCEGFGEVRVRVRSFEAEFLAARDAVYQASDADRQEAIDRYLAYLGEKLVPAAIQQVREPIRAFGWRERALMLWDALVLFPMIRRRMRRSIPAAQAARGRRRTEWSAPGEIRLDG